MKSFYEILEVPERASAAEIRSAYLKLAREYHPDRVPEHLTKLRVDAEVKFKQVQEAWSVLGDPVKRRRYDIQVGEEPPLHWSQPAPAKQPSATRHAWHDLVRGKKDFVKLALSVVVMTLVFVVIGEVFLVLLNTSVRQYSTQPRHIRTWSMEGGSGLDIQLLSVAVHPDNLEVSFRVRAGEHGDLLLYEPPGSSGRTRNILGKEVAVDSDLGEIYIADNMGEKFYSTTGLAGGKQVNFNLYNFTRRINVRAHEEVILSAKFPPITASASSITFVSPALGKWQPEWRWPAIGLK